MSRTKPQIVNFYAGVLHEAVGLTGTQYDAVRTALAFACSEIEDNSVPAFAELHNKWADANNEVVRLQKINGEAEEEIGRLCSQLQALEAKQAAPVIHVNGTHPTAVKVAAMQAAKALLDAIPNQADDQQAIPFDAQAAQEAAGEAQPDPTTPASAGETRRPAAYKWPTLDDVSLEIVTALERKRRQWQSVTADDKRIIVLAMIGELSQDLPPGETLSIETFNRHKPRWMPTFASVSTSLGMTWKQMLAAAPQL